MSVAGCGKRQKIQIQHLSRLRRQMRRVHTKTAVQQKLLTVRTIQKNVDMAAVEGTEAKSDTKRTAIRVK